MFLVDLDGFEPSTFRARRALWGSRGI